MVWFPHLRRLDHVVDSHWLTGKVLEVMDACSPELQRDAVAFLPEIAQEDDYEVTIGYGTVGQRCSVAGEQQQLGLQWMRWCLSRLTAMLVECMCARLVLSIMGQWGSAACRPPRRLAQAVLNALQLLMESDTVFVLPVIEAVSNLSLSPAEQACTYAAHLPPVPASACL